MLYDLRHAFRALLRRPGLSLAVLLILALGISATTTIFSIASSVLLGTIPYKDGDRLVALEMLGERDGNVSPYDPLVFIAVPCVIALSSLPAILRPAWRADKVDPSSLFRTS